MTLGVLEIKNNKIHIEGVVTKNPTIIGLAVLNEVENRKVSLKKSKEALSQCINNIEKNKVKLKKYLKGNKQRNTSERLQMLKIIHYIETPFNAEELFKEMKEKGFEVSLATIYNNISLFLKSKIIIKINNVEGFEASRFELNFLKDEDNQ